AGFPPGQRAGGTQGEAAGRRGLQRPAEQLRQQDLHLGRPAHGEIGAGDLHALGGGQEQLDDLVPELLDVALKQGELVPQACAIRALVRDYLPSGFRAVHLWAVEAVTLRHLAAVWCCATHRLSLPWARIRPDAFHSEMNKPAGTPPPPVGSITGGVPAAAGDGRGRRRRPCIRRASKPGKRKPRRVRKTSPRRRRPPNGRPRSVSCWPSHAKSAGAAAWCWT